MSEHQSELDEIAQRILDKSTEITLSAAIEHSHLRSAQTFLNAACSTVSETLLSFRLAREFAKAVTGKSARGRLTASEMDLLRAAIVFAGAGLDATLKELIRCALPFVIDGNELARAKFQEFAADLLGRSNNALDYRALASILAAANGPWIELMKKYRERLTGDSLQSAQQVSSVAGALGIDDETLRKRMTRGSTLDAMFRARNLIVHELDLTNKSRTTRTIDDTERWVREALDVCQAMINTVARALPAPEETVFPWRRRRKKQQ